MPQAAVAVAAAAVLVVVLGISTVVAEDPYLFFEWHVTYGTVSPLGVPQQAILINGQFPGPNLNVTTNNNIIINVFNNLDEPLLFTWNGIQQRKNSWQDGVPGTNCPIPAGTNFTYHFQAKDQIGSYYYFPSLGLHRAIGGFGGLRINSRPQIPVPFPPPADDYTVLIGDWFTKSRMVMSRILDSGRSINRPSGILINGKSGKDNAPMFTMEPGLTYRYRICNMGTKTSLNFRIQSHLMKVVEIDGSHTVQNIYDSLDIHLGQCFSVLITANQAPRDYYMVVSTRFTKYQLSTTGIIRYAGSEIPPSADIPAAPVGWAWSLNQWRSFRWNLTASAARPNPQGSYHYGGINITRTIQLANSGGVVGGKRRFALNGVSHTDPETPLKLAEYFGIAEKVFKYDIIGDVPPTTNAAIVTAPNVLNATYHGFVEIIFENSERVLQSYHLDGYSFFAVGMGPGKWTPASRNKYNLLDAVSRHTIHVYPNSWSAILLTFDNPGMWNLRSTMLERSYLGQQLYVSVLSVPRSTNEYIMPDYALLCGAVVGLPLPPST